MAEQPATESARVMVPLPECDPIESCDTGDLSEADHSTEMEQHLESQKHPDGQQHQGGQQQTESKQHPDDQYHSVLKAGTSISSISSGDAGTSTPASRDPESRSNAQQTSESSTDHNDAKTTDDAPAHDQHKTDHLATELDPWLMHLVRIPHDHPGWARELSPSLSLTHSTPPEVNKWAQSFGIQRSLNYERDDILHGYYLGLQRSVPVRAAMVHTDDVDFPGFLYPYGAWGIKTPLRNAFLPRRSDTKQRSKLCISATPDTFYEA